MDAVTAAVALMGQQMAVERLNKAVDIVKEGQEMDQAIVDLVAASADSGALYSSGGQVPEEAVARLLNAQA